MITTEINFGLIAVDIDDMNEDVLNIYHFCGYEDMPTEDDIKSLREELKTDESFGLMDIIDKLTIIRAPQEIIEEYKKYVEELN